MITGLRDEDDVVVALAVLGVDHALYVDELDGARNGSGTHLVVETRRSR
jgi:DNA-binding IclR family transcriptional regulator